MTTTTTRSSIYQQSFVVWPFRRAGQTGWDWVAARCPADWGRQTDAEITNKTMIIRGWVKNNNLAKSARPVMVKYVFNCHFCGTLECGNKSLIAPTRKTYGLGATHFDTFGQKNGTTMSLLKTSFACARNSKEPISTYYTTGNNANCPLFLVVLLLRGDPTFSENYSVNFATYFSYLSKKKPA